VGTYKTQLNIEFSFPSNLSNDFNLLMKSSKNHSHNKLNGKQQLPWSRFAFITRNMGHNTATMSASMGARSGQNSMNCFYQYRINITFCSLMVISTLRIILHVLHLIFYFCEVWNS